MVDGEEMAGYHWGMKPLVAGVRFPTKALDIFKSIM